MNILILNSGSSSQKSALYRLEDCLPKSPEPPLWEGKIEWEEGHARWSARNARGASLSGDAQVQDRQSALQQVLETLWNGATQVIAGASAIDAVGHRVVHGGEKLAEPVIVTAEVVRAIEAVSAFAPLHIQAELEGIELAGKLNAKAPQVAVFDTGFHRALPLPAAFYPGPYEWFGQGIRRYGFHGINHQYCAERAAQLLGRDLAGWKIVSCHLGNGCSLAAIQDGRSIDTTMGFTPLEGLMMGTRSGSVDPGILTYLARRDSATGEQLDRLLNRQSGLLGISGVSSDMRSILAAIKKGNERAQLAFDIYVHRLRAGIAAMAASLGGIDALVFTAGVGEHSPEVREAACENMGFLGVKIDTARNRQPPPDQSRPDQEISSADSAVRVLVIRAEEDWSIAAACWKVLREQPRPSH